MVVRKEHNHPPNPAQTTTQLAVAEMRKRAREESVSMNQIYDDQLEVCRLLYTVIHNNIMLESALVTVFSFTKQPVLFFPI